MISNDTNIAFIMIALIAITLTSCPSVPPSFEDIPGMKDEFDSPSTMADWIEAAKAEAEPSRLEAVDMDETADGCIRIRTKEAIWWQGYHGAFLYKNVSGDFTVSTRVKVTGLTGEFPDHRKNSWQIAGILLRKPVDASGTGRPAEENWVFNTFGSGIMESYLVDIGETRNSIYTCYPFAVQPAEWMELRLVRLKKYVMAMIKRENGPWELLMKLERPDLPETLQVGMMANSSGFRYPFTELVGTYDFPTYNSRIVEHENKPNLLAYFDYMRFKRISMSETAFEKLWGDKSKILELFRF